MSFKKAAALLSSAVALVGVEFTVFGKLLVNLAPPLPNVDIKVGMASFFSLAILLVISLVSRNAGRRADYGFAIASTLFLLSAIGLYWYYENLQAEYIYRYPPSEQASYSSNRYIRGELHEGGLKRIGDQSIAAAVADLGGVDFVVGQQLLWSERSQRNVELKLVTVYLGLVAALGAALYCLIVRLAGSSAQPRRRRT